MRTAAATTAATPSTSQLAHRRLVDHRLDRRGRPAVHEARTDPLLQRRAVQLPRVAPRAREHRRPVLHLVRHRGRPRVLATGGDQRCLDRFRGMFAFSLLDERTGRLVLARDQLGIKPLYYLHRDRGARVRVGAESGHPRARFRIARRRRGRRRVDPVLLGARPALCDRGSPEAATGIVGRDAPRRVIGRAPVLGHCRGRGGRRGGSGSGSPSSRGGLGRGASGVRCARVHVPQRRPRLEHRDRARQTARSEHRRIHDPVPTRGPTVRGNARRRPLRTSGRAPVRHRLARDRDRSRHRRPAPADGRRARRARRGPRRDQHPAHLRECPSRGREGAAFGDGRRRALRRLPEARRLRHGIPLSTPAARSTAPPRGACGGSTAGGGRGPRRAPSAVGQAVPDLRGAARGGGVPPQLHALWRGRGPRRDLARPEGVSSPTSCEEHQDVYADTTLDDHVNRMCLADSRLFLPGLNLAYTDRASMAASTEVRVPFVDVDLVRAAFALPRLGQGAWSPRETSAQGCSRGMAPDARSCYRPKASFGAPIRAWVSRDLRPLVDEVLLDGQLVNSGVLRHAGVSRLVEEDRQGRRGPRQADLATAVARALVSAHARNSGVGSIAT